MSNTWMASDWLEPQGTTRVPRHVVDFSLAVVSKSAPLPVQGRAENISVEGIAAVLTGELGSANIVTLSFVLPMVHEAVQVRAFVRHRDGYRYGFEFLGLSDDDRDAIDRMCERLPVAV